MTRVLRARVDSMFPALVWDEPWDTLKQRLLSGLKGCDVDVTITKHKDAMSGRQRRYYFGAIVPLIAEYCGYEKDEMHEALAWKFLRIEDDDLTGAPRRKHLPALDSPEGAEYLDRCIRFGAELGVYIPAPGEVVA